jgi:chromosome segregation ATPase
MEKQRDELSRHHEQAAAQGESRDAELAQLNDRIKSLNERCAQQAEHIAQSEAAFDKQRQRLEKDLAKVSSKSGSAEMAAELTQLREEKARLEGWLREAEGKAAQGLDPAAAQELDDLKQRLELAMQDCRDLKNKNAELAQQLDVARTGSPIVATGDGAMDWESQKRRMIAQLEADFDQNDEQQQRQKLSIEEAIQKTEQAVAVKEQELAVKDQEIEALRRQLENQASSGEAAVHLSSAAAGVLDKDELVRQERESLKKLQDALRSAPPGGDRAVDGTG